MSGFFCFICSRLSTIAICAYASLLTASIRLTCWFYQIIFQSLAYPFIKPPCFHLFHLLDWYSSLYETISLKFWILRGREKRVSYESDTVSSLCPLWWSPVMFIDLNVDTPTFWRAFWATVLKKVFSTKEIFTLHLLALLISPVFSSFINEFTKEYLAPMFYFLSDGFVSIFQPNDGLLQR